MEEHNVYAPPASNLEQVVQGTVLASRWDRLWGALIDGFIAVAVTFPVMFMTGYWENARAQNVTISEIVALGIFGVVAFVAIHGYLLAKYGQTVGKRLVGTKIVSSCTDEILPLGKIFFIRYLPVSIASQIPVIGGFLAIIDDLFIFRKDKRCFHDLLAGTKVIKASTTQ